MRSAARYLLFPGRHLVLTRWHEQHLKELINTSLSRLPWSRPPPKPFLDSSSPWVSELLFAVTSSNQPATCRYNPLPYHTRVIGCDRFARSLRDAAPPGGLNCRVVGIPHYRGTHKFAEYMIREIEEETEGALTLTPENTAVLTGTESVQKLFAGNQLLVNDA